MNALIEQQYGFIVLFVIFAMGVNIEIKYYLRMLQQNSYRNDRFIRWFLRSDRTVFYMEILSFAVLLLDLAVIPLLLWGVLLACVFYLRMIKKEKVRFVLTSRVKRLWLLSYCIIMVALLFCSFNFNIKANALVMSFTLVAMPIILILSNVFLVPIEKLINNFYVRDAKNKIAGFSNLNVIGVTGSYGKTSTKFILKELLEYKYNVLVTPGNFNTLLGVTRVIREQLRAVHQIFIVEMGAREKGDIAEICELVEPSMGIITKIGSQHLEMFKSIENIKKTKYELFDSIDVSGTVFINKDDPEIYNNSNKLLARKVTYSIKSKDSDYYLHDLVIEDAGSKFVITTPFGELALETKLLGRHNVENILASVAIACELRIDQKSIRIAIKSLKPVSHRLEARISSANYVIIDNAYNSNPDSVKISLEVLAQYKGNKKILITPGIIELGDREEAENQYFGENAASVCDVVIVVGASPGKFVVDGLKKASFPPEKYFVVKDLSDAIKCLSKIVEENDVVLYENDLPDTYF